MSGRATVPINVLLIEDDARLCTMLSGLLSEEGYRVRTAHDGLTGLDLALTKDFGALIVDRALPAIDGLEVVRALRDRGVQTPVMVLTARGAVADRVEGLDVGAEDYLVKPFEIPEFLARLRALTRRLHTAPTESIEIGSRRLMVAARAVVDPTGAHPDVQLSDRECALLMLLARSPGQVFTRAQILDRIFDDAAASGTVDTYVHYLRGRLGRDVIRTVHGLGYRMGAL